MTDPLHTGPGPRIVERSSDTLVPIRDSLHNFVRDMELKLTRNDHKAHWSTVSNAYLFMRLLEELAELARAMVDGDPVLIHDECVDVANMAMMIADNVENRRGQ